MSMDSDGMRRSAWASVLEAAAGTPRLRGAAMRVALRLEGGVMWSRTARAIMAQHCSVTIGAYSYGDCFVPGAFPPNTVIGRYVSIASGVRAFARNHPMERLSLHPFFYNSKLGFVKQDTIVSGTLEVGHDAWIGERAIIAPGCRRVGIGAVVGAGAVVTRDVPDFAIVAGNPARILRHRFDQQVAARILASRWWERSVADLTPHLSELLGPVPSIPASHPLIAARL